MKNYVLVFIFFALAVATPPNIHKLNLEQALQIAAERNYNMRTLRLDLKQADLRLKAAISRFRTQVSLLLTAPGYTETVRQFEDSLGVYYTPVKQFNYTGNLEISQPLPTDGRIYLRSGFYGLQDYGVDRNTIQLNTRIGIEQPIEALYAFNNLQSSRREAELNYELSQKRLVRAELNMRYEVSSAFYNLVSAAERLKIARQTLESQRSTTTLAQNKYRAGVIAEVEALQMEIDLAEAENNFDIARSQVAEEANALKQLLAIPLADSLVVTNRVSFVPIEVDVEKALDFALHKRLEIRESEIERELSEINMRRTRLGGFITGSISAYYDFIGVSSDPGSTQLSRTLDRAWTSLQDRPGNRGLMFTLRVPIWDWGQNKANVQAARINLTKSVYTLDNEKVRIEREIRNLVNRFKSSQRRTQLLQKNIAIAEKSFEISKQQFANGEISSQQLALNRARLSNAHLSFIQAYISYKLQALDLTRKTFYDFEGQRPL